jgi:hypothetical protein
MTKTPLAHFRRHRFPAEVIAHAVCLYFQFPLSFRDVEDLLAERGINVSFQTVSEWAAKFGLKFAHQLRLPSRRAALPMRLLILKGRSWLNLMKGSYYFPLAAGLLAAPNRSSNRARADVCY